MNNETLTPQEALIALGQGKLLYYEGAIFKFFQPEGADCFQILCIDETEYYVNEEYPNSYKWNNHSQCQYIHAEFQIYEPPKGKKTITLYNHEFVYGGKPQKSGWTTLDFKEYWPLMTASDFEFDPNAILEDIKTETKEIEVEG